MDIWGGGGAGGGGGWWGVLDNWVKTFYDNMTRASHISKILLQTIGKLARFENKLETSHS